MCSSDLTWNDQNGNQLQMHGLGIIKVGGTYYGFGEDKTGESSGNTSFQNIPCYSSTNLGSWTYQREALTRQSSGDLGPNRIVERPKVIYNSSTQQYVMYMHIDNLSYGEAKVGVATSSSVCGPYSYRGSFQPLGQQSRDLGLFQGSDGSAYLLSEDRANGLRIDALSSDYLSVTSSVAVLADYEAPTMVEVGGRYYLFGSHLTGWSTNDNQYTTATSLSGPWSSWHSFAPSGTNTCNSQTANIITVQGSSGTTYVYAGDRWNTSNLGASPLVWLPLTISGTAVSMSCLSSWSIDAAAGTWSSAGGGSSSYLWIENVATGLFLDGAGRTTNGADVAQWSSSSSVNQQWVIEDDGGYVRVRNVATGLYLDGMGRTSNGSAAGQWADSNSLNQQWSQVADGSHVRLRNRATSLYLDGMGRTSNGSAAGQWADTNSLNQQWDVVSAG